MNTLRPKRYRLIWLVGTFCFSLCITGLLLVGLQPQVYGIQPSPASTQADSSPHATCTAATPICELQFLEPITARSWLSTSKIYADRKIYYPHDQFAQFVVNDVSSTHAKTITLQINDTEVITISDAITSTLFRFFVNLADLDIRQHVITTTIDNGNGSPYQTLTATFAIANPATSLSSKFPSDGITITVHPLQNIPANANELFEYPVSTGIPLPNGMLINTDTLRLVENGIAIPAQFTVRSTWQPLNGYIRWLGVDFTARYDGSQPRKYMLRNNQGSSPGSDLKVSFKVLNDGTRIISITNRFLQVHINRQRFDGIAAWFDTNSDGKFSEDNPETPANESEQGLFAAGGPYWVDEDDVVYSTANYDLPMNDGAKTIESDGVYIEENGSQRVTLRITGWYQSYTGQQLCKFLTRISIFANSPEIQVDHRTLITFDTREKQFKDLGWNHTLGRRNEGQFAFGSDGKAPIRGAVPQIGQGVFLHQETDQRFRVVDLAGKQLGEGKQSAGWLTVMPGLDQGSQPTITFTLRDIYQKFPKELELHIDMDAPRSSTQFSDHPRAVFHFWPRHGTTPFTDGDETINQNLLDEQIYKIRYAHEGKLLSLQPPPGYVTAVTKYLDQELGGKPDSDGELAGLLSTNGQGLAVGNEFSIYFSGGNTSLAKLSAQAAIFQQNPHALSSPEWNAASGVIGKVSAIDPQFDEPLARTLSLADPLYLKNIVEAHGEYGMWIYGNVHNDWNAQANRPSIHRVWQASHYQGVWAGWMRYFLGADPGQWRWARVNSGQYMDIGTVNYADDNDTVERGKEGYMYHGKGFLPWGGDSDIYQHFVDPGAHLFRYYLTGDQRGRELFEAWFRQVKNNKLDILGTLPEDLKKRCDYVKGSAVPRDRVQSFGEMVEYYQATWDPYAVVLINEHGNNLLDIPFECIEEANQANFVAWGKRWFHLYYDLTRDKRMVTQLYAWIKIGQRTHGTAAPQFDDFAVNAFVSQHLSETLGITDTEILTRLAPILYDNARIFYDNREDDYYGYGLHLLASENWLLGAPYFVQAMKDACLAEKGEDCVKLTMGQKRGTYPGIDNTPAVLGNRAWGYEQRGWSTSSTVVLVKWSQNEPIAINIEPRQPFGDPRGAFWLVTPKRVEFPSPPKYTDAKGHNCAGGAGVNYMCLFEAEYTIKDTFPIRLVYTPTITGTSLLSPSIFLTHSQIISTYNTGEVKPCYPCNMKSTMPLQFEGNVSDFYRVEVNGPPSQVMAPYTDAPEAAVIRQTHLINGSQIPSIYFAVGGRQHYYFRPTKPYTDTIVLRIAGGKGKNNDSTLSAAAMPVYYEIAAVISDTSRLTETVIYSGTLFAYASLDSGKAATITLNTDNHGKPAIYRFYSATSYGHEIQLVSGANELLLSTNIEHLNAIAEQFPCVPESECKREDNPK